MSVFLSPAPGAPSCCGLTASWTKVPTGCRSDRDAGESPLFPPLTDDPEEAKQSLLHVVRRDPHLFGIEGTRWTLDAIKQVCRWLGEITPGGLSQLLDRLEISWKRSREHIHSPDPNYEAKLDYIAGLAKEVRSSAGCLVLVYLDELSFYRQPTLANSWEEYGRQALAERSYQRNTVTRTVASLDLMDGRVLYRRRSKIGVRELVGFYQDLHRGYGGAERIYAVQDNWPVHAHADVLVALEPQETPWPWHRPASWSSEPSEQAREKYGGLRLPIQVVQLPTYASWTNPIEKLWRKLKQEVLHLHRLADKLSELRALVDEFLHQFAMGSLELLRYVGLLKPG